MALTCASGVMAAPGDEEAGGGEPAASWSGSGADAVSWLGGSQPGKLRNCGGAGLASP